MSIVITDNDSTAVNLSVSSDPITEGYLGMLITATLDKVSELPVTVTFKSSDGDSTDYYFSEKSDTSNVVTLAAHYTFSGDVEDNSGNDNKVLLLVQLEKIDSETLKAQYTLMV